MSSCQQPLAQIFLPRCSQLPLTTTSRRFYQPTGGITHTMADQDQATTEQLAAIAAAANDDNECPVNYKAPAKKTLEEIQSMDQDDESLRKYKEKLLGNIPSGRPADPSIPNVQVTRMTLVCESAPNPLVLDLQGDLGNFKNTPYVLKEGVEYRIKINFKVNYEIVSGLKYNQQSFRKGIKVDKSDYMVGSYGPKAEEHEFVTPIEESPKGMMARGTYTIKSKFTDDDKHDHLSWEWSLSIKKDWTE